MERDCETCKFSCFYNHASHICLHNCYGPEFKYWQPKEESVKFKVGDRVRITEDNPNSAPLKKGHVTTISEAGIPSYPDSDVMGYRVSDRRWWVEEKYLELVKEEPMKTEYRVLKEISLLTIAQAGPKGCSEFRNEWDSLMFRMKRGGFVSNWLFRAVNQDGLTSFDYFIKWAEENPKRIQWLIDKGFIERVDPEVKCIFCGGACELGQDEDGGEWYVDCFSDGCYARGPERPTKKEAIEAWYC